VILADRGCLPKEIPALSRLRLLIRIGLRLAVQSQYDKKSQEPDSVWIVENQ
jgi:hypothetical protein